jgi:hypothetical protein
MPFALGTHMSQWTFWEWLTYVTTWIAALVLSASAAVKVEPDLQPYIPKILKDKPYLGFVPLGFLFIGVIGIIIQYFNAQPPPQYKPLMTYYGINGIVWHQHGNSVTIPSDPSSKIEVDGGDLTYLGSDKYKLLGVVYHVPPTSDRMDVGDLSKSALFDIRNEHITITIFWNKKFIEDFVDDKIGSAYSLLAIPVNLDPKQFGTLRQAVKLGAKILEERGGPP